MTRRTGQWWIDTVMIYVFAVLIAGVAIAWVFACAPRPRVGEIAESATPHCFRAEVRTRDGSSEATSSCWEKRRTCRFVRGLVVDRGGAAGVVRVDECSEVGR